MSKYLGALVVVLTGLACGGTADTGDQSGGGASQGGQNHGGSASGGSVANAGKASGGDRNMGGDGLGGSSNTSGAGGSIGVAGSISVGGNVGLGGKMNVGGTGGTGGAGMVDPRCPAKRPMGTCDAADTGFACEYDALTSCLCYTRPPGVFTLCQKVDPTCPGAGGTAAAPPPNAGEGGVSAKIALPPQQLCRCLSGMWTCGFGI